MSKRLIKRLSHTGKPHNLSTRQSIVVNAHIVNQTHKESVTACRTAANPDILVGGDIERRRVNSANSVLRVRRYKSVQFNIRVAFAKVLYYRCRVPAEIYEPLYLVTPDSLCTLPWGHITGSAHSEPARLFPSARQA